jgi:hypothetical protein
LDKEISVKVLILALALVACAVTAGGASAATRSSCSDVGFTDQASASMHQGNTALQFMGLESYRSGEAYALRSWQTMQRTAPCRPTYQRYRQDALNASAALWRAVRAMRSGNSSAAESYLGQAGTWTDRAGAEQANWG